MVTKLQALVKKYEDRRKQGYDMTPIDELLSDLWYLKPKKKSAGCYGSPNLKIANKEGDLE
jgi:hypothetical protein